MFYERQFQQLEEDAARQKAVERLAESARRKPPERPVCAFWPRVRGGYPSGLEGGFGPLSGAFLELSPESLPGMEKRGDEGESRIKPWRRKRRPVGHVCPQCGKFRDESWRL